MKRMLAGNDANVAEEFEKPRKKERPKKKKTIGQKLVGWLAILVSIALLPILIANLVIIVRGSLNPDEVPTAFGFAPMAVVTESMNTGADDAIKAGDLVVTQKTDVDQLQVGDVIMYQSGQSAVIHRIVGYDEATNSFITKGDANNTEDIDPVTKGNIIGKYILRVPTAGKLVLFSQTPLGMLICIGIPLVLLLGYDFLAKRFSRYRQKNASYTRTQKRGA